MSGWNVGDHGVLVVGVEGVIEAVTDDAVTISGTTLPRRFDSDRGVRYLSVIWPDDPCSREHCGPSCDVELGDPHEDPRNDLECVLNLIERNHYSMHDGAYRTCMNSFCREVNRSLGSDR